MIQWEKSTQESVTVYENLPSTEAKTQDSEANLDSDQVFLNVQDPAYTGCKQKQVMKQLPSYWQDVWNEALTVISHYIFLQAPSNNITVAEKDRKISTKTNTETAAYKCTWSRHKKNMTLCQYTQYSW